VGSTVAHELKNPLTAVKALVQLGARNPAEAASRERLETVEREVSRMQDILQDYLSFSRPLGPENVLGVVLAKGAFVQHGGSLRYESAPGAGTTAIATLPVGAAGRAHGAHPARG
jgi:signal transduction histidine kinase